MDEGDEEFLISQGDDGGLDGHRSPSGKSIPPRHFGAGAPEMERLDAPFGRRALHARHDFLADQAIVRPPNL